MHTTSNDPRINEKYFLYEKRAENVHNRKACLKRAAGELRKEQNVVQHGSISCRSYVREEPRGRNRIYDYDANSDSSSNRRHSFALCPTKLS